MVFKALARYIGGIPLRDASCDAMSIFALMASSIPPRTINPAIALTGAELIHFFIFLPSPTARETSISSSSTTCPRILLNAKTRGSCGSLCFNSVKIDRALCQSPLSMRQSDAAIRGRTPVGSSRINFKESSRASSCLRCARINEIIES